MKQTHTTTGPATACRTKNHRARWAAIGAAVAVSLGAGGIGLVRAATPDGASMYVGTSPCRLLDTRPGDFHIGPHGTLGADSKITVTAQGNVGECTGARALPNNASGLQLNVTPIGATQPTNLRVYPGAGDAPNASSLNPVPDQPPIPNAVAVQIDDDGRFSIYNFQGNVDVAVDVVGYFTGDFEITGSEVADGSLTGADVADGSLTGAEIDDGSLTGADVDDGSLTGADVQNGSLTGADVQDGSISSVDIANEPGIVSRLFALDPVALGNNTEIGLIEMDLPSAGFVTVDAVGSAVSTGAGYDRGSCKINHSGTAAEGQWVSVADDGSAGQLWHAMSLHRTVAVEAGLNSFRIICDDTLGTSSITDVTATAMFTATSYPNN